MPSSTEIFSDNSPEAGALLTVLAGGFMDTTGKYIVPAQQVSTGVASRGAGWAATVDNLAWLGRGVSVIGVGIAGGFALANFYKTNGPPLQYWNVSYCAGCLPANPIAWTSTILGAGCCSQLTNASYAGLAQVGGQLTSAFNIRGYQNSIWQPGTHMQRVADYTRAVGAPVPTPVFQIGFASPLVEPGTFAEMVPQPMLDPNIGPRVTTNPEYWPDEWTDPARDPANEPGIRPTVQPGVRPFIRPGIAPVVVEQTHTAPFEQPAGLRGPDPALSPKPAPATGIGSSSLPPKYPALAPPPLPSRPPRGTKEKKSRLRSTFGAAAAVLDAVSEGAEFIDALYSSLPSVKAAKEAGRDPAKEAEKTDKKFGPGERYNWDAAAFKAKYIYDHFNEVDNAVIAETLGKALANAVEDALLGAGYGAMSDIRSGKATKEGAAKEKRTKKRSRR